MRKLSLAVVFGVCGFVLAGPAAAVSLWHGDVYTSKLLGDAHVAITLPTDPGSISELLSQSSFESLGAGLGSGYVKVGSTINLTHTFAPDAPVSSITKASLVVGVLDDLDLGYEEVAISVNEELLDGGKGRLLMGLFGGSVAALIRNAGDSIQVSIAALTGDFKVGFSALAVEFESTPTPAIPEPTAALVFAAGLALVARRR